MNSAISMSRAVANEILALWKSGAQSYPQAVITAALYVTGDLESAL